jgi:hypothetical protein
MFVQLQFVQIDSMIVLCLFAGWECFPGVMIGWTMNWKIVMDSMMRSKVNSKMTTTAMKN